MNTNSSAELRSQSAVDALDDCSKWRFASLAVLVETNDRPMVALDLGITRTRTATRVRPSNELPPASCITKLNFLSDVPGTSVVPLADDAALVVLGTKLNAGPAELTSTTPEVQYVIFRPILTPKTTGSGCVLDE